MNTSNNDIINTLINIDINDVIDIDDKDINDKDINDNNLIDNNLIDKIINLIDYNLLSTNEFDNLLKYISEKNIKKILDIYNHNKYISKLKFINL